MQAGADTWRVRIVVWTALAVSLNFTISGCGDAPVDKAQVTLTIRSEGTPERQLLNQIYARALRAAGYKVKRASLVANAMPGIEALKAGKVAGFPEYMSTALFYNFGVDIDDIPPRTEAAYRQMENALEDEGLTAFPPAPYSIANAVGLRSDTAEERGLEKISDLKGQAEEMRVKAPTYCHVSTECIGGIERYYNTAFERVQYERARTPELSWWRAEPDYRYEVLEDEEADASILYTTDGRLATEGDKFVILEDDRNIFPASNFVWVTSPEVVDEAGPDYEETIVNAQKGLTLDVIRELNAKVELEGKRPATVAAEYLSSLRSQQ